MEIILLQLAFPFENAFAIVRKVLGILHLCRSTLRLLLISFGFASMLERARSRRVYKDFMIGRWRIGMMDELGSCRVACLLKQEAEQVVA